ncbi:choice-of-anchor Q domain-containing protein [Allohahella marinimesophila]|uniref:CSLREA domain-containing protein n=1 Tax=Allohahella marinimesophila TaxID=1054972 RepID=A0ABP7NGA4_9GAMM
MTSIRRLDLIVSIPFIALISGCSFTVDSTADRPDSSPGDGECADALGFCTLRAAVTEAHESAGVYTINIPPGTYTLDLPDSDPNSGYLNIQSSMALQGSGTSSTIIDAEDNSTVIRILGGNEVALRHLTITGGNSQAGGGVYVDAGNVQLFRVRFSDNYGFTGGGGLLVSEGADVEGDQVEFDGNSATGAFGGAVWNFGRLVLENSLLVDNESNRAGALHNNSTGILNLYNVTISGNRGLSPGRSAGGMLQNGFAVLRNVTITGNTGGEDAASVGAGGLQTVEGKTTVMKNSLLAGNTKRVGSQDVPSDCVGPLTSDSRYNLIQDESECDINALLSTYILNEDPNLLRLANNGGPTRTHAIGSNSPALNAGYPFTPGGPAADACRATDQRGVPRPQSLFTDTSDGLCDLGAYEAGGLSAFVTAFYLVDTDSDTDIREIRSGDLLIKSTLPENLSIRAQVSGSPGSVVFDYDETTTIQIENNPPYALASDSNGDYQPFDFANGPHTVTATPRSDSGGTGSAGGRATLEFRIF